MSENRLGLTSKQIEDFVVRRREYEAAGPDGREAYHKLLHELFHDEDWLEMAMLEIVSHRAAADKREAAFRELIEAAKRAERTLAGITGSHVRPTFSGKPGKECGCSACQSLDGLRAAIAAARAVVGEP